MLRLGPAASTKDPPCALELSDLTEDARFEIVLGATHESLISNRGHRVVVTRILAVVRAARVRSFGFDA